MGLYCRYDQFWTNWYSNWTYHNICYLSGYSFRIQKFHQEEERICEVDVRKMNGLFGKAESPKEKVDSQNKILIPDEEESESNIQSEANRKKVN